jgi:hypothetical protein
MDPERIITNDLYCAAFLLCCDDCRLVRIERNRRNRISFVLTGTHVRQLREAYRSGPVLLDIRSYRDTLKTVRRRMDETHRSALCQPKSLNQSLKV